MSLSRIPPSNPVWNVNKQLGLAVRNRRRDTKGTLHTRPELLLFNKGNNPGGVVASIWDSHSRDQSSILCLGVFLFSRTTCVRLGASLIFLFAQRPRSAILEIFCLWEKAGPSVAKSSSGQNSACGTCEPLPCVRKFSPYHSKATSMVPVLFGKAKGVVWIVLVRSFWQARLSRK